MLGPTLKGVHLVDDPDQKPYGEEHETIWEGLGILEYAIMPHYQSEHPESDDVEQAVQYLKVHKIPFKTLRDGEVLVLE